MNFNNKASHILRAFDPELIRFMASSDQLFRLYAEQTAQLANATPLPLGWNPKLGQQIEVKSVLDGYVWYSVLREGFGRRLNFMIELLPGSSRTIPLALNALSSERLMIRELVRVDLNPHLARSIPKPPWLERIIGADILNHDTGLLHGDLIVANHILDDLLANEWDAGRYDYSFGAPDMSARMWKEIAECSHRDELLANVAERLAAACRRLAPRGVFLLREYPSSFSLFYGIDLVWPLQLRMIEILSNIVHKSGGRTKLIRPRGLGTPAVCTWPGDFYCFEFIER
jgi:hypothetical protein